MRSIQDVGTEIMSGNPASFYIFTGSEYGVKTKYIDTLRNLYGDKVETNSVNAVLDMMNTKHLIPLEPKVYVVRYDDEFLKSLDDNTEKSIVSTDICGTIVCLYEKAEHANKLDKYLSNYTVDISGIGYKFVVKYLHTEFPNLPDKLIESAAKIGDNYEHSRNIARCMCGADVDLLYQYTDLQLKNLFGVTSVSLESDVRNSVASRNFRALISTTDKYDDLDSCLYTILNTLVELEKIYYNKYAESSLRQYVDAWTPKDIYNMFMNTYSQLKKVRTYSIDMKEVIMYLASLLQFKEILEENAIS